MTSTVAARPALDEEQTTTDYPPVVLEPAAQAVALLCDALHTTN